MADCGVSISHWGMFSVTPAIMRIPHGFKLSEKDLDALRAPGKVIIMRAEDRI